MSDMLTRLSISVSTKNDAKGPVADHIVVAMKAIGATIADRKGDKHGEYITVELPPSALEAVKRGVAVSGPLKDVNDRNCGLLVEILAKRAAATKLLKTAPEERQQYVTAPSFVPMDDLVAVLVEGAEFEIDRCDAVLESWGFRYVDFAK